MRLSELQTVTDPKAAYLEQAKLFRVAFHSVLFFHSFVQEPIGALP